MLKIYIDPPKKKTSLLCLPKRKQVSEQFLQVTIGINTEARSAQGELRVEPAYSNAARSETLERAVLAIQSNL